MEEEARPYERFIISSKARQRDGSIKSVDVYTGFLRVPEAILSTPIPPEATELVYGEAVETDLRQFALNCVDLNDGTHIISLSANHNLDPNPKGRVWHTNEQDFEQWLGFIAPFGFTESDVLTQDERNALIPQPEVN